MSTLTLAVKTCTKCGEVKPLSEFHRRKASPDGLQWGCKTCQRAIVGVNRDKRREEMGDAAFREWERVKVAVHRQRTGNATGKEYARAVALAMRVLRDRHRTEYDHLLLLARRGELDERSVTR